MKKRGGHRALVRRYIDEVKLTITNNTAEEAWVKVRLEEINRQIKKVEEYDSIIQDQTKPEEIDEEIEQASEWLVEMNEGIFEIREWLGNRSSKPTKVETKNVKLPNIELQKFNGDPLEWQSFWDLFRASIDERGDLSGASKFYYLIKQLEGDAALLLKDFDRTDDSYKEAVSLLERTFAKPKVLIQARLHALFDLPGPSLTAGSLGRFRSRYEAHIRGLSSLGANIKEAGYIIAAIILRKLPKKIAENINRASNTTFWTLEELRGAIEGEMEHLAAIGEADAFSDDSEHGSRDHHCDRGGFGTRTERNASGMHQSTINAFANQTQKGIGVEKKCAFCSEPHSSSSCTNYESNESRREQVRRLNLCYNCLRNNHIVQNCLIKQGCLNCKSRHHTSICPKGTGGRDKDSINVGMSYNSMCNVTSVLPTAMIPMQGRDTIAMARCLFDSGSQRTLIHENVASEFGLVPCGHVQLCIEGIGSSETGIPKQPTLYPVVKCILGTNEGLVEIEAVVTKEIPKRVVMNGVREKLRSIKLGGITLADPNVSDYARLDVLIGVDNFFKFVHGKRVHDSLYAIPSNVGDLLIGSFHDKGMRDRSSAIATVLKVNCIDCSNENLNETLKHSWDLDKVGISDPVSNQMDPVLEHFERTITYDDSRYTVGLPWKLGHPPLETNYAQVYSRLQSILRKLRESKDDLMHYDKIIHDQLEAGFIETVDDKPCVESTIHYLAHQPVFKKSATTPLRVVFDCSAKPSKHSPSLNECLHSGPSLINEMCSVLLRFRLNKFACTADISKAFLQVGLREEDRDCTRFLWPETPSDPNSELVVYRFKVVLFGATCSQFLLNATVLHHLDNIASRTSAEIKRNIYVDNVHYAADTEGAIMQFYEQTSSIMEEAGFPLKQWCSNSNALKRMISERDSDSLNGEENISVLGLNWNSRKDTLSIKSVVDTEVRTKRQVISEISKHYDPLGLFIPVSIKGRVLIQKIWKRGISWDDELPGDLLQQWKQIAEELNETKVAAVDRMLNTKGSFVLNVFSDASMDAYGAAAYISDGENSKLLFARGRVAPIKN